MIIGGIDSIAWLDPATGDAVQANLLADEIPLSGDDQTKRMADGSELISGSTTTSEILVYDTAARAQLEAWAEALTRVRMVAIGLRSGIQWLDAVPLRVRPIKGKAGDLEALLVAMSLQRYRPAIYSFVNLLQYLGWKDANADGLADGFTATTAATKTFVGSTQAFTTAAGGGWIGALIELPVTGATLTFSAEFTGAVPAGVVIELLAQSWGGATLAGGSASTAVAAAGRTSVSLVTPTGTKRVLARIRTTGSTAGVDVAFRYPALRTDGVSAETRY